MNKEDLISPRIVILHLKERAEAARQLYSIFKDLGARVALVEVKKTDSTRRHRRSLYYFDDYPRFAEIAQSLAKITRRFEPVKARYVEDPETDDRLRVNFAIWMVRGNYRHLKGDLARGRRKKAERLAAKESPASQPKEINGVVLVKCPECNNLIGEKRLEKHINRKHRAAKQPPEPRKTLFTVTKLSIDKTETE